MKRGEILRTILFSVLVAIILVYGGYGPFLSYMGYLSVREKCKELAKFARMYKDTEEIKNLVMEKLKEEGFYFSPLNVSVYYEGDKIIIRAMFSDTLKWLGDNIIKPINYKVEVKRLPVSIN
jgi:hypothetical protein